MEKEKSEQVYEVLLTPIEFDSEKYTSGNIYTDYRIEKINIYKKDSIIRSSQSYYPYYEVIDKRYEFVADPDMTDFACGFYEIIYRNILGGKKIVREDGNAVDTNYVGDTMNSFHYIANRVPEAGKKRRTRTPYDAWPKYLQEYYKQYHCLANFWMLPKELGRQNMDILSKGYYDWNAQEGAQDYMDRFLALLQTNWEQYNQNSYFEGINNFYEFARSQYLIGNHLDSDMRIVEYSKNDIESVICLVQKCIRMRAKAISQSKEVEELYNYFKLWKLCE